MSFAIMTVTVFVSKAFRVLLRDLQPHLTGGILEAVRSAHRIETHFLLAQISMRTFGGRRLPRGVDIQRARR
jgi:hypothetical protein